MKITSYEENLVFNEKAGAVDVTGRRDGMIAKPLNISCVQYKAINTIMAPGNQTRK